MRRLVVLLVLAAPLALAATGAAGLQPKQATLAGQVIVRGAGLGCLREPCWKPIAKVPVTISRNEVVVVRALSGPDGWFRVALAPGVYTVRAPGLFALSLDPVIQRSGELRATLRAGQTTRLTLVILPRAASRQGGGRL